MFNKVRSNLIIIGHISNSYYYMLSLLRLIFKTYKEHIYLYVLSYMFTSRRIYSIKIIKKYVLICLYFKNFIIWCILWRLFDNL